GTQIVSETDCRTNRGKSTKGWLPFPEARRQSPPGAGFDRLTADSWHYLWVRAACPSPLAMCQVSEARSREDRGRTVRPLIGTLLVHNRMAGDRPETKPHSALLGGSETSSPQTWFG